MCQKYLSKVMLRSAVVFFLAIMLKDITPNLKFLGHTKLLKLQSKSKVNKNFLSFSSRLGLLATQNAIKVNNASG